MRGASKTKTQRSRRLRREQTDAEAKLWWHLRRRGVADCKFVRQQPVGPYICDFVCRERRLVVEVDGGQHNESSSDRVRDRWLGESGYRVVRFWNNDVLTNVDGVLLTIERELSLRAPHPVRG